MNERELIKAAQRHYEVWCKESTRVTLLAHIEGLEADLREAVEIMNLRTCPDLFEEVAGEFTCETCDRINAIRARRPEVLGEGEG